MNKKIKLIVVSLILLVIVGINISYAISIPDTSSFFEVNKKELASGETLEMIMDLSQINYEQFELVLSSNVGIEKVYADSDITFNQGSNDVVIDIDKAKLNLNKIVLYYQIPENVELGTKLQLKAQAIIIENDEEKVVNEKQIEIAIVEKDSDSEDNKNQEDNKNEDNEKEENKNEDNKNEEIKSPEQNVNKEIQGNPSNETLSKNLNQNSMQKQDSNTNKSSSTTSNSSNAKTSETQTETATYNGSNNNYLFSLEIDGVQLTSDFNKEKSTYFATVEGFETITVTANVEEASSKVAITGTNLKSGENKVLISVTAENGDVRYYRIYVTKI